MAKIIFKKDKIFRYFILSDDNNQLQISIPYDPQDLFYTHVITPTKKVLGIKRIHSNKEYHLTPKQSSQISYILWKYAISSMDWTARSLKERLDDVYKILGRWR